MAMHINKSKVSLRCSKGKKSNNFDLFDITIWGSNQWPWQVPLSIVPAPISAIFQLFTQAHAIASISKGLSKKKFKENRLKRSAIFYEFIQLGEIVKTHKSDLEKYHPNITWHKIIGLRNRLAHDVKEVNFGIVWSMLDRDFLHLCSFLQDFCLKFKIGIGTCEHFNRSYSYPARLRISSQWEVLIEKGRILIADVDIQNQNGQSMAESSKRSSKTQKIK